MSAFRLQSWLGCGGAAVLIAFSVSALDGQTGITSETVSMGYHSGVFIDVNREEARAIIDMFAREFASAQGANVKTQQIFYDDMAAIQAALAAGELDMAVLPTLDYLRDQDQIAAVPTALWEVEGKASEEFVLLARRDHNLDNLAQLRGRTLVAAGGRTAERVALLWLETQLLKAGLGRMEEFFSQVKEFRKSSQALLPVFFGQADVCLVDRSAYESMAELNPQVGKELVVLGTSPGFPREIVVINKACGQVKRALVRRAFRGLEDSPRGRQILQLFGISREVEFAPSYLQPAQQVLVEHDALCVGSRMAARRTGR
jgi:ABC-type phosphate/phosphonate transport system substrate-binding protein